MVVTAAVVFGALLYRSLALVIDGVGVPDPSKYSFHERPADVTTNRTYVLQEENPRTFLMCPQEYAIEKIVYGLVKNNATDKGEGKQLLSGSVFVAQPGAHDEDDQFCPTLQRCLFHQACVFRFGNEFCMHDPAPGVRKMVKASVTCTREQKLASMYPDMPAHKYWDQVLHLRYRSRVESGVRDYLHTPISEHRAAESEVFDVGCPTRQQAVVRGFRGQCSADPAEPAASTWTVLARASRHCRDQLMTVLCAFLFDGGGMCLPPQSGRPGQAGFDYEALPMPGPRHNLTRYTQILSAPERDLIPVRIGFLLLVHKDVSSTLQLLEQIYRPQHYYVVHADARAEEVRRLLTSTLRRLPNVRVLPGERSFATSWASYNIVRAELEALEELLRLGVWDHAVVLSGSDLAIRSVDELAAALAAHRGTSMLSTFDGWKEKPGRPSHVQAMCDNHVYTLSATHALDPAVRLKGSSQWFVLSRDMAEFATNLQQHPAIARRLFRFRHHAIPDEFFFSTLLYASPYR
ncbi:xylosyltransferase 2-like [Pollicipes pollicipes]|uniref:xylosyltransferase 2-like n=1 Tax=Pollicipes pollicipes TaxID=41117 RepID=UPI00188571F3|nr:xylosyltransferase 2-like [Pollicipes pollicipes]